MIIANLDSSFALRSCCELEFPKNFPKLCQNVEEEEDDNDDEAP